MNPFTSLRRVLRRLAVVLSVLAVLPALTAQAAPPDPSHAGFDTLLRRHVAWNPAGVASTVSYAGFAADRAHIPDEDALATASRL